MKIYQYKHHLWLYSQPNWWQRNKQRVAKALGFILMTFGFTYILLYIAIK